MLQQIHILTLAAAAKADIDILSYGVEKFHTQSGDEHMALVTFRMDGEEYEALEYFDRRNGQLTDIARYLDTKGLYNKTQDAFRLLIWHPMTTEERTRADILRAAIHSAMKDAIRESRRRPTKKAA